MAETAAESGRRDVFDNEIAGQVAERREIMAAIAGQRHAIERLAIRSPLAGVVDQTFVFAGEYVAAGQRLMATRRKSASKRICAKPMSQE